MRVLLDTSVFVIAYQSGIDAMPRRVQRLLSDSDTQRLLSTVSLTEVAIKTTISRGLVFPHKHVKAAISDLILTVMPFTADHAHSLFELPSFEDHRDPFDRMLIATALSEGVPIVSHDGHFRKYEDLNVLWE